MEQQFAPQLPDVDVLLETSRPQPRMGWFWYAVGAFAFIVLVSAWAGSKSSQTQAMVKFFSGAAMFLLVIAMSAMSWLAVARQRAEQQQLEAVEELVQLRRWPQAMMTLQAILAQPARSVQGRAQALLFLAAVLARYQRFDDAVKVQEHLLDTVVPDGNTAHALRLGRAMALLQQDHLFDADRAISELRRGDDGTSAGLALVEIYRDVKTGHPAEAIETFRQKLPEIRAQLGQRVADAWALAAKAFDMVGQEADARVAYRNATLLASEFELHRRYLEVRSLAGKYPAAPCPVPGFYPEPAAGNPKPASGS